MLEYKPMEIKELSKIAARAERGRLRGASRQWIISQAMARSATRRRMVPPPWILAAAVLVILISLPAILVVGRAGGDVPDGGDESLDLRARLAADGAIVLEWQNGRSVHTVRRAGSAAELSKVAGTRVRGGRFLDPLAGGADILYYQVD